MRLVESIPDEKWETSMTKVMARHAKIPLHRRLALKWTGWTCRHVWSHCPRYHEDDDQEA